MADRRVRVVLEAQIAQFQSAMRQARESTGQIAGGAQSAEREYRGMGSTIMGRVVPAVAGLVTGQQVFNRVFKAGFDRLATLEQAEKAFTQMGLSTEQVTTLMESLNDTVTDTPFRLDDGASAMARFVSAGMPVAEIPRNFEMLADAAAFASATTGDFAGALDGLTHVWERVQTEGRLTGETLRMLQVRGVPALQLLADAAGVTGAEMRDMISRGEIGAEQFFALWERGAQGFGENNIRMAGAAKSSGDTIAGAMENAQTALSRLGAAVLDPFLPSIRDGFDQLRSDINGVINLIDQARDVAAFEVGGGDEEGEGWFSLGEGIEFVNDKINEAINPVSHLRRGLEGLNEVTGGSKGELLDLNPVIDTFRAGVENLMSELPAAIDGSNDFADAQGNVADRVSNAADVIATATDLLAVYQEELKASTDPVFNLVKQLGDVEEKQTAYNEAVDQYGKNSPEAIAAGWDLAESIAAAEAAALNGDLSFDAFEAKLASWVEQGLLTEAEARAIAGEVKDLRGEAENYQGGYDARLTTSRGARSRAEIQGLINRANRYDRSYTATLRTGGASKARAEIQGLLNRAYAFHGRVFSATVNVGATGSGLGVLFGSRFVGHSGGTVTKAGIIPRMHDGGEVTAMPRFHNGSSRLASDEVPAILQTGEIVLSRRDVALMSAMFGSAASFHNGGMAGGGSGVMELRHTFVGVGPQGEVFAQMANEALRKGQLNIKSEAIQR